MSKVARGFFMELDKLIVKFIYLLISPHLKIFFH